MTRRAWKTWAGVALLAACALVGTAVALGSGTAEKASRATTTTNGTTGGTADRATTETDSSNSAAAYEVHVTKADGSHVVVILDKSYAVLSVESQPSGFQAHGFRRH
jgi:hypothetical protein